MREPPRHSPASPDYGELAGLGLTIGVATALFAWGGNWLDDRLGTSPLFVLLGAFLGFGGGFYSMYARLVMKPREGDQPDDAKQTRDRE